MDNLSGKPNYYKSTKKDKDIPKNENVSVDYTELIREGERIQKSLEALMDDSNELYCKFNKKELHDTIIAFHMANRDILKLLNSLKN